ncbi:unnamed protein product [Rotaria socialis]
MGVRSARKIHGDTKVTLPTISYQLKKLRTQGSLQHRQGNGRKRKIDAKCARALGQFFRRNSEVTLHELTEKLQNQCKLTVSTSTISRHLNRLEYVNCLPLNTPMLTEEHKERRVEWAKEHLNDDWKATIFTDESSFQLFRNTIRRWSKCAAEEKKRIPKNRQKVHVSGSISYRGRIVFHSFQNIMDSNYYIEILENNLIMNAKRQFKTKWRLQQDNDPKHRSSKTERWLSENVPVVMNWPANSPDLNPIENIWNIMKHRIEKRKPKNINELKIFIDEEWNSIEKNVIIRGVNLLLLLLITITFLLLLSITITIFVICY